jgi:hypothetical protein
MKLTNYFDTVAPRERSGALSSDRFHYQKDWALCKILALHLLGRPDLSRKFVRNVLVLLHRIFEEAIDSEMTATNPAHRIKLPSPESESVDHGDVNPPGVPNPDEVVRTFGKLPLTHQVLIWMGAVTGLRRG